MALPPNALDVARLKRMSPHLSYQTLAQSFGNAQATITAPRTPPGPIQPAYTNTIRLCAYPNAVLAEDFGSKCATFIQSLCGYVASDVVTAACICSDDKNAPIFPGNDFGQYPVSLQQFSGPFFAGGIGGYPFPGIVGLFAWSSHITDTGALFLYVQPHIGVTVDGRSGFMNRRGQGSVSGTCGAVAAAQGRIIGTLSAVQPTYPSSEFTANDFQQFTLTNILWSNATVRSALTSNRQTYNDVASPTQQGYGARMVIATNAIRDASASVARNCLSAAYTAFFGANSARDVFFSVGTFINVDDGYKAYVDVNTFERYNAYTGRFVTLTNAFTAGLLP